MGNQNHDSISTVNLYEKGSDGELQLTKAGHVLMEAINGMVESRTGQIVVDLKSQVDDLVQVMTGSREERDAALRRIAAKARERAVDAHDDDWGKEAPDDADPNRKSVRGKKQGDDGYGEAQEGRKIQSAQDRDVFNEVTSDPAAGAVGRYVAAISKTTRRGY